MQKTTKNIFIIYNNQDWRRSQPFRKSTSRDYFEKWYETAPKHGFRMYRASIKWFDFKKGVFTKCWTFTQKSGWVKVTGSVNPDFMIDFTSSARNYSLHKTKIRLQKHAVIINTPEFRMIFDSKISQQLLFRSVLPKGVIVNNPKSITRKLSHITTKKVVIKESFGVGGDTVHIVEKKDALEKTKNLSYPIVLQKCINTSHHIPGHTKHESSVDLRIIYVDHKPVFALSRIAENGSLFTNFNKGAHAEKIPLSKVPQEIWRMSTTIQDKLKDFNGVYYALDFIFDKKGKAYFMEVNTTPGFALVKILSTEKQCEAFFDTFFTMLKK